MRIDKSRLNPLYHQYSNDENRLTHALLHTVASSSWIFPQFMRKVANINEQIKRKNFEVTTQKVPSEQGDKDPEKIESIPDAWIVDDSSEIGLAIEVKDVRNSVLINQLESHSRRILNYKSPYLLVITPDLQIPEKVEAFKEKWQDDIKVKWRSWDFIYRWLKDTGKNTKGREKDNFIITSMLEYLERRRAVLGFHGISFRSGFNVGEAKDILNAEMEAIQPAFSKIYPLLTKRRPAITTNITQVSVWDCFGKEDGFTSDIHFTFSIREKYQDISMTIPNSAGKTWSRLKAVFSDSVSESDLFKILKDLRRSVPHLYIGLNQRHFEHRRFGIQDGFMEFDIDTLGHPFRNKTSKAKEFPVWKLALREAIINKKNVNAQAMFKSRFYYNKTKEIDSPGFIEIAIKTVKAFKPLYDYLSVI